MNLLPVGTIIETNGTKLMIMGYREFQTEKFVFFYIVAVYPIGFTGDENSLSLIPINKSYALVSLGYSDSMVEKFLERENSYFESLQNADTKELDKVLDMIIEEK